MSITESSYPTDQNDFIQAFHRGMHDKTIFPIIGKLIKKLCLDKQFNLIETLLNKLSPGFALQTVLNSLPKDTESPTINRIARINEIMTEKKNPILGKAVAQKTKKLPKVAVLVKKLASKTSDQLIKPVFLNTPTDPLPSPPEFNEIVIPLEVKNLKLKYDPNDIVEKFNGLKHQGNTLNAEVINFIDKKIQKRVFGPSVIIYLPPKYDIKSKVPKSLNYIVQILHGKQAAVFRFSDNLARDRFLRSNPELNSFEKEIVMLDRCFVADVVSSGMSVASTQEVLRIEINDQNYTTEEIEGLVQEYENDTNMFKVVDTGNLTIIIEFLRKENGLNFFNYYQDNNIFDDINILI